MSTDPLGEVISLVDEPRRKLRFPRCVSVRTVARRLDVSLEWVRIWHREGLIHGYVLHATPGDRGRLLFLESDVVEFLAKRGLPIEDAR